MRAVQIVDLTGPESALAEADVPEPEPSHMLTPGSGVVIDVHAAGVSFPEVLQTRGEYQIKPPLPFVPGSEVAGTVRSAPEGSGLGEGDRVAACCMLGAFAEVAVAPDFLTFPLSEELDYAQGAGLILNYHTAYFSLTHRGRLAEGETAAQIHLPVRNITIRRLETGEQGNSIFAGHHLERCHQDTSSQNPTPCSFRSHRSPWDNPACQSR